MMMSRRVAEAGELYEVVAVPSVFTTELDCSFKSLNIQPQNLSHSYISSPNYDTHNSVTLLPH